MTLCAMCSTAVDINKYFTRKSTCPKCGGDLHICLNCSFYSVASHNKCSEPKAEFQRSRDKANFCDYFSFRESTATTSDKDKKDTLKKLEDLFRKS